MPRNMTFASFGDLSESGIEFQRTLETIDPKDENIVNNRVFVWRFEPSDLQDFVGYFEAYYKRQVSEESRQILNRQINGKLTTMLNGKYMPIECMLYASKVINSKLKNDVALVELLAERIRSVYLRNTEESIEVFNNILEKWTSWTPQLRVVITAIGIIGDNEDLLDKIFQRFANNEQLRVTTFHAFLQNKNSSNLDRAMRIVVGLREDVQTDEQIGRIFQNVFVQFGRLGSEALSRYAGNPGISKLGNRIITKLMNNNNPSTPTGGDEAYRTIARSSRFDNQAYESFKDFCIETRDSQAFFLCRFSRADIVTDFLEPFLKDVDTDPYYIEVGLISVAYLYRNGYRNAENFINEYKDLVSVHTGYIIARLVLGNELAAKEFVDLLVKEPDFKLRKVFGLMRNAAIRENTKALGIVQSAITERLNILLRSDPDHELINFTSNLSALKDHRLFYLLSNICLDDITRTLINYSAKRINLDEDIVISLIDVGQHKFDKRFEQALFELRRSATPRIQNHINTLLKNRAITPPK